MGASGGLTVTGFVRGPYWRSSGSNIQRLSPILRLSRITAAADTRSFPIFSFRLSQTRASPVISKIEMKGKGNKSGPRSFLNRNIQYLPSNLMWQINQEIV